MEVLPQRQPTKRNRIVANNVSNNWHYDYVVIGGGIAGVSCSIELSRMTAFTENTIKIALVTAADTIKEVSPTISPL